MKCLLLAYTALIASQNATPVFAQTIAITGGTVAIGDGSEPIPNATVIIRDGKIVSVGSNIAVPTGAEHIDATGKWITPGLFAGFSRLGLSEVEAVEQTNDTVARRTSFSVGIDTADAINPRAKAVAVSRANGITRAVVAPAGGNSIFGGQGVVIDTGDDLNPITKAQALQYVEFGEAGSAAAGGSRAASFAYFRNAIAEARDYRRGKERDDLFLKRPDLAALLPVIDGRVPLMVMVESAVDIHRMLKLKAEFPTIRMILGGVSEGWEVASEIAAAKVPVVVNPMNDLPDRFETLSSTQSNAGRMAKAGVSVSFGQIGDFDTLQIRLLPQYAGNMVALTKMPGATGMQWGQALASITSRPAEMMGLGDQLGTLKAGYRADVALWDGDPLELSSAPNALWIDGVRQTLDTRQDRLRERYKRPNEGNLPKAYDR
jgi:imidazolonepropionase-like amidohydrolase